MKRFSSFAIGFSGALSVVLSLPVAADVWVDRHAVGSTQDGTQANPYLTIQAGVDARLRLLPAVPIGGLSWKES